MHRSVALLGLVLAIIAAKASETLDDLERLVKLKEAGHLDHDQYQQFVEKLMKEEKDGDEVSCPPCAYSASTARPHDESRTLQQRALQQSDALDGAQAWFKADNAKLVFGAQADCSIKRQHPGDLVSSCPLHASKGVKIGAHSGASCSTAAHGGFVRYNAGEQKLELCDGEAWGAVGSGSGVLAGDDAAAAGACTPELAGQMRWVDGAGLDACLGTTGEDNWTWISVAKPKPAIETFKDALLAAGVASPADNHLQLVLDAADPASYPDSGGRLWHDVSGRAGVDHRFWLGQIDADEGRQPTFTRTNPETARALGKDVYFAFDGNDCVRMKSPAGTFVNFQGNDHAANAWALWFYYSADHGSGWDYHIFGNGDWGPKGQTRLMIRKSGSNYEYTMTIGDGSPNPNIACVLNEEQLTSNWHFAAGHCVQGSGGGGGRCFLYWDGELCAEGGGFTSGTAVAARFTVAARSDSLNEAFTNGAKLASLAIWFHQKDCSSSGTCVVSGLPDEDDFDKIWEVTHEAYGV